MLHAFIDTNIWIRVLSQGRPGCELEHLDACSAMASESRVKLLIPEVVELELEKAWRDFREDLTQKIGHLEQKVDEALKKQVWTEVEDVHASIVTLLKEAKQKKTAAAEENYKRVQELFNCRQVVKLPLTPDLMFQARKRLIAGRMPKPENQAFNDACIVETLLGHFRSLQGGHELYFCSENVSDFGLSTKEGVILHPVLKDGLPPVKYATTLRDLMDGIRTMAPAVEPAPAVIEEALEQQVIREVPSNGRPQCFAAGCGQVAWHFGPFCREHLHEHLESLPTRDSRRFHETVRAVLETLTYREREVFRLRTGLGDGYTYTRKECARIFKCSESTIRRLEARAERKLSHPARASLFNEFF